jgi:N6-adenosine-specific RNA methylase IME4
MGELVRYDAACRAIAEAKAVDEVKGIRDQAEAMRHYGRQAKNRQLEADAWAIKERAEIRLGELISQQKATVGLGAGRPAKIPTQKAGISLTEVGIDHKLSSRAQKKAALPKADQERLINEGHKEILEAADKASARIVKASQIVQARESYEERKEQGATVDDLHALVSTGRKFSVIYADPPWEFKIYSGKGKQRSAERYYDTMSLGDIRALPVEALAADDCALFLWAVMPELPGALDLIEAWGFAYKTAGFTWAKLNRGGDGYFTGMGYWTRANAELCLLATRGSPMRLAMDVPQLIVAPVREHSQKPDETAPRIERLLAGPYLELFARAERPGWTVWGNEIGHSAFVEAAE